MWCHKNICIHHLLEIKKLLAVDGEVGRFKLIKMAECRMMASENSLNKMQILIYMQCCEKSICPFLIY